MMYTIEREALNLDQRQSSRIGNLVRTLSAALMLTAAVFASQPAPAQATPAEECVKSCVADYYPFWHGCAALCGLMDFVFGVHGDYGPTRPFSLAAEASSRTAVELQVGQFDEDTGALRGDRDALAVVYSYASLSDFESRNNDKAIWHKIGNAAAPSPSATWPLVWNASRLKSGEYLLRAEFIQPNGSKFAISAVDVP